MNVDSIKEVYEFVVANPEKLKQEVWTSGQIKEFLDGKPEDHNPLECGTTACMAGWRSILSAPKGARFYEDGLELSPDENDYWDYDEYAADKFGVDGDEAYCLFYHTTNLSDIRSCLLDIFHEHNETIPEWLQNELDSSVYGGDVFEGLCTQ